MYIYYFCTTIGHSPAWKHWITRLQLVQFASGCVGGTVFFYLYIASPHLVTHPPFLKWSAGARCMHRAPLSHCHGPIALTQALHTQVVRAMCTRFLARSV
jgi:hypothetical protein